MSFLEPSFVVFIALFFPICFALSARNAALTHVFVAVASFGFLAFHFPPYATIVLGQVAVMHAVVRGRIRVPVAIAVVLAPLVYFKYAAWIAGLFSIELEQPPLPIGISFYTFTAIAAIVEIVRSEKVRDAYSVSDALGILAFWPHLASGPVLRPKHVWRPYLPFAERDLKLACVLICFGLFKKVVIADNAGAVAARAMEIGMPVLSAGDVAYAAIAMTVQIYGDFSGYSDMALGFALLIGVRLPANFNFPYTAASISEFWRRWHISLSTWFRDYLYFPLGGNRAGEARTYLNFMIVFVTSGLWHGAAANFLLWGALHGTLLCVERATHFTKLPAGLRRCIVLPVIAASWLVFFLDMSDLSALASSEILTRPSHPNALGPSVLPFFFLVVIEHLCRPYEVDESGYPRPTRFGIWAAPVALLASSLLWSEPLPFIYFEF